MSSKLLLRLATSVSIARLAPAQPPRSSTDRAGRCAKPRGRRARGRPGERARSPVRAVQGERRGQSASATRSARCSAATCATPTGSATTSPTPIYAASSGAGEADLAALARDRPRDSSTRPTRSPTTCSNIRPGDTLRGYAARPAGADRGPADQPFLRLPHFLSRPSPAARARRRSRRSPTMRTTSSATTTMRSSSTARSAASARAWPAGVVETKLTIRNVIDQLDTQLTQKPEDSPFYGAGQGSSRRRHRGRPGRGSRPRLSRGDRRPTSIRPTAAARFPEERISAAGPRRRRPVVHEGRRRLYQHLIEKTTTLPLTADEVHNLGLSEVARITAEMEAVKPRGRLQGHAGAVLRSSAHRPQVRADEPRGADRGLLRHRQAGRRQAAATISRPSRRARSRSAPTSRSARSPRPAAATSRARPTASRPGIFYFNAYDLPSRTTPGMKTLYLHEGAPGHHFQISLAQENEALPPFMRFGGNTAFVEGWALYAETLGLRAGLLNRPLSALRRRSTTRCCARCGWSSTPASTPRAGPASRRSTTCSTTAAWARPTPPPRSSATSPSRARRSPTRSAR